MYQIFEVPLESGLLGIAPMPGRSGLYDQDLISLFQWSPSIVLSMTTALEMEHGGADALGSDLTNAGIHWVNLPVPDFGAPPEETVALWEVASAKAHRVLISKGRVLAHCYGGCGRSGMAVLRLMAEAGVDPDVALERLRQSRPCAVETDAQFRWAAEGYANG